MRAARLFTALRSVLYAAGFVWLWSWIGGGVRSWDARMPVHLPPAARPVGAALAVAGALLVSACIAVFVVQGRGTPAPFDAPREFVANGPYRWVRNPMYLGAASVVLGMALLLSSPSLVLLAVGFLALAHVFVVLYEEPTLAQRFGASYERYRASVPRWRIRRPASHRTENH